MIRERVDRVIGCRLRMGLGFTAVLAACWSGPAATPTTRPEAAPPGVFGRQGLRGACVAAGVVIAVGDDGVIARSTDGGRGWTSMVPTSTGHLLHDVMCEGDTVVAVGGRHTDGGWGALVMTSHDRGATWRGQAPAFDVLLAIGGRLSDLWMISERDIFHSTDGVRWRSGGLTTDDRLIDLAVRTDRLDLLTAGGFLLSSTNRGESWTPHRLPPDEYEDLVVTEAAILARGRRAIVRSVDRGATWSSTIEDHTTALLRMGDTIHAEEFTTHWRSTDDGATWQKSELDAYLAAIAVAPDGAVFGVGGYGVIVRSDDRGVTWRFVHDERRPEQRSRRIE